MRKIISIALIFSVLTWNCASPFAGGVAVASAQETPSQPESPTQPESPQQPENPESPDQPENPTQPENPDQPGGSSGGSEAQAEEGLIQDENPSGSVYESSTGDPQPAVTDTGSQDQTDGNFGDTTIVSGDADALGVLSNSLNSNVSGSTIGSEDGASVVNSGNNSGSQNSAEVSDSASNTTTQNNEAAVVNNATIYALSGDNEVRNNMNGDVLISSGDANAAVTVVNQVNTNLAGAEVVEFNVVDDHVGDLVLDFSDPCTTGGCVAGSPIYLANVDNNSDSQNTASYDSTLENETFQNNDAVVENNIVLTSDSGYNLASDNMNGDVAIETGDANVSANVTNFVNNNIAGSVLFGVVNIFGDLVGDIILPEYSDGQEGEGTTVANSENGSGSDNFASVDQSIQDSYTQTNDLALSNTINGDANTGDNNVRDNISGNNSIETGNVNAVAQILNVANNNIIGGNWWIVLINEAGNWIGRIVGGEGGTNYAGSAGTEFIVNPDGTISAYNTGNNSNTTNTTDISQSTQDTYEQTNNASISNNLTLTANTGSNTIKDNANGDTSIVTGDANIVASVVNFVNNNIVGGRVYVTIVNVFGSWLGNFVGPGQEKDEIELVNSNSDDSHALGGIITDLEEDEEEINQENMVAQNISNQLPRKIKNNVSTTEPTPGFSAGSNLFASASLTDVTADSGGGLVAGDSNETAGRKIRINLAWLFVIIPAIVVPGVIKRRFFLQKLSVKDGGKN